MKTKRIVNMKKNFVMKSPDSLKTCSAFIQTSLEAVGIDRQLARKFDLLSEEMYRKLQAVGEFDLKTSSWIQTPEDIRMQGGALFCERRYGVVFTFHNGADSYYSVRGWRGMLLV